jgi:hypothetical protein
MKYIKEYREIDFSDEDWEENDDSDIGNEEFSNFLHKHGLFDKFIKYFNGDIGGYNLKWHNYKDIRDYIDNYHPSSYIQSSFDWKSTREGFSFWKKIQTLWLRYLRNGLRTSL